MTVRMMMAFALLCVTAFFSSIAQASSAGITGRSISGCAASGCHGYSGGFVGPYRYTGTLYGDKSGSWSTLTQTLDDYTDSFSLIFFLNKDSGSNAARFGLNVSTNGGTLAESSGALNITSSEIHHTTPHSTYCLPSGPAGCSTGSGDRHFTGMTWTPPSFTSGDYLVYACGNVVDNDGAADAGDNDSGGGLCDTISIAVRPRVISWSGTLSYTEGDGYVVVDSGYTQYASNLRQAVVSLTNPQTGDDLACPSSGTTGISCSDGGDTITFTPSAGSTYSESSFETAVEGVRFANTSDDPNTATTRTVTLVVRDEDYNYSLSATRNISVTAVNDAPSISNVNSVLGFTEGNSATVIDSSITLSDPDSTNFNRAEVQIYSNYQAEDVLACPSCGAYGLSSSYSAGLLAITGSASISSYDNALQSVTYANSSQAPSTLTRSVRYRVRDTSNSYSSYDTTSITVAAVNDAPTITNVDAVLDYNEGDGAQVIDGALTVADVDSANLNLAEVWLYSSYASGEDTLACPSCAGNGLSSSFSAGTLTISGTASVATYDTVLQSVTYSNSSEDPSESTRSVAYRVRDTNSAYSGYDTTTISVTASNDAPSISGVATVLNYVEDSAAQTIDSSIAVSDIDSTQFNRAEVQITGNFASGEDLLACPSCAGNGLSTSYSGGLLAITGTALLSAYESVLESVTYENSSDAPSTSTRTVAYRVRDTGNLYSGYDTTTIGVSATNDDPVISGVSTVLAYVEGNGAQIIDSSISLSDVDSTLLNRAEVSISANFQSSEDTLAASNCSGLSCSYSAGSGLLTITGTASLATYETVLESVTYSNSSENPSTLTRTVSYRIRDNANAYSSYDPTTITVQRENDAPVITEGASTPVVMSEDGSPTPFSLTLNATDVDADTLTWSINTQAGNGVASASGTGASKVIGYTPDADYNGVDSFIVQVSDGLLIDTITVNVTLSAQNDAPVISEGVSVGVVMSEDSSPTPFSLTLNATDAEGSTLNWSVSSPASNGSASASGSGASKVISYVPTAQFNGADSFVVQVSDGLLTDTIIVNVTVDPENDAPVITEGTAVAVGMSEDNSPVPFSLTLNATDIDADTLTWSINTQAGNGTASASGTGASKAISYTPTANYNGADSFIVQVSDGTAIDTITVNVTLSAQNDAPVITEGSSVGVVMSEDGSPTPFSLTLNASDAENSSISWNILTQATNGVASVSGTGTSKVISYTPTANYNGADSFVVRVSDGLLTDSITVNVTVNVEDDSPVITQGDSVNVNMSEDGSPTPFSRTLNVTDIDSAAGSLTWSISSAATNGVATASGTGLSKAIGYTPDVDYTGADSFVVQVSDGSTADTITVNVNITGVNDAPVITEGASVGVVMSEDSSPSAFNLTLNATDAESSPLTWSISSAATNGVATASGTGASKAISYTPTANFSGADSFVVQVSDGVLTDTITVNVTIDPENDNPIISEGASVNVLMSEDSTPTAFALTLNATDIDSGTLTWSIDTAASNGSASASGTGASKVIGYSPDADHNGADSFVVLVSDGAATDTITVNVTVTAEDDAPTIDEGAVANVVMSEDGVPTPFSLTLNASDTDTAAGGLTWSINSAAAQGSASVSGTGTSKAVSYTAAADYAGADSFVVQVSDGVSAATITVNVTLDAVNDAPIFSSTPQTSATETETYTYNIGVTDPDDSGFNSNIFLTLNTAPAGMTLNPSTGVITWTPPVAGPTPVDVEIQVEDGNEDSSAPVLQNWQISVDDVNDAPIITSTAPTTATEDTLYSYAVAVTDPDDTNNGANLTWQLTNAPTGMSVSSTGVITWTPLEGVLTSGTVTVQVADGGESGAGPDTENFTVSVTPVNDAPVISALPSANAIENTLYNFAVTVADPDDSSWSFSLSNEPSGMSIHPTSGLISWTPAEGVSTSGSVTVTVADGGGDGAAPDAQAFTIGVTAVNDAPQITSTAVTTATEDTLYQYQVVVTDSDDANNGTDLSFSLPTAPAGMTVSSTGLIQWTPVNGVVNENVQVLVADGGENGAAAAQQSFAITVTAVNDSPQITSTAITTATEAAPYSYQVVVTDVDDANNGVDLTFSLLTAPTGMTVSTTGLIEWTPPEGATSENVDVRVQDDLADGATPDNQAFVITVTAVNNAPQITSTAPVVATEDVQYSYQLVVDDPDDLNNGADLSFSLTDAPTGMVISATGLITWTPEEGVSSSGSVTVDVQDGGENGAAADSEIFTVTVAAVNDAPVITDVPFADAIENALYSFNVLVADPDDSAWDFSLTNAPTGMSIDANGLISWTPAEGVTTSGLVTVNAADGGEDSVAAATENFTIGVIAVNDAPVITALPSANAVEDAPYSFNVLVADPDDSSWAFSLNNAPAGMTIDANGLITWTPDQSFVATGSGSVTVNVADGGEDGAAPDAQVFVIGVTPVNDAPTITALPSADAVENTLYTFTVTVSDPDDSSWNFSLQNAPAGMTIDANGLLSWTPGDAVTTSGAVTVVAEDSGTLSDSQAFTIGVTAVNDAPLISALPTVNAVEDTLYTFNVLVTDPDDSSWAFSLSGEPAGMTIDASGVIRWTPVEGVTTSGSVSVTAADGGEDGAVPDVQNFSIGVTAVNDAPTITAVPTLNAVEDSLYNFAVQVADSDDSSWTFSLTNAPTGMSIDANGLISWTPGDGVATSGTVTVMAADGGEDGAASATQDFSIGVTAVNDAPLISALPTVNAIEDTLYSFNVLVTDPDDSNWTFSISNEPTGMTIDANGLIQWTPLEGVTTSGSVTVNVADGGEDGAVPDSQAFTIGVTAVNDAPVITALPSANATEDAEYNFAVTVTDSDDSSWTFSLSGEPVGMTIDAAGVIRWTPTEGDTTSGSVTVSVADGGEDGVLPTVQNFTIGVTAVNDGPIISSVAPLSVSEDLLYQYPLAVTDPDDANDGNLIFTLQVAPAGMTISSTGLIQWTATEQGPTQLTPYDVDVQVEVRDGEEDGALPDVQAFTLSVSPVNDGPTITQIAAQVVEEESNFDVSLSVTDPDDLNNGTDLTWGFVSSPTGMTISPDGNISWTPGAGAGVGGDGNGLYSIIVSVADGGEDSAPAGQMTFELTVTVIDGDGDGVADYDDNCPADSNADQANNDADSQGDVCDPDDDNDGISDVAELANGLDPFDDSDASGDIDNDGESNLAEFMQCQIDGDVECAAISQDTVAPVISFAPVRVNSTGFLTPVRLEASATDANDGEVMAQVVAVNGRPVMLASGEEYALRAGANQVTWRAQDASGNATNDADIDNVQTVEVVPQVLLGGSQIRGEGQTAQLTVYLNGPALSYPITVHYGFSGTASALDVDVDVTMRRVDIVAGQSAVINIPVVDDGFAEGDETLTVTLLSVDGEAVLGTQISHDVLIVERQVAPEASIVVTQNGRSGNVVYAAAPEGFVTATAMASDANDDALSYRWGSDNPALETALAAARMLSSCITELCTFDPVSLDGTYPLTLFVSDGIAETERLVYLSVNSLAVITLNNTDDQDGDGADDAFEGQGDSDDDGIADYLDVPAPAFIQQSVLINAGVDFNQSLQTNVGLTLALGPYATAMADGGVKVASSGSGLPRDESHAELGGIYDVEIRGLNDVRRTASMVIPLLQPIAPHAQYRTFETDAGWLTFTARGDSLSSAARVGDACPDVDAPQWQAGLQPGLTCLRVTITDGGPNDADGVADGTIRTTAGVALVRKDSTDTSVPTQGPNKGGGSLGVYWCLLAGLVMLRRRRFLPTIFLFNTVPWLRKLVEEQSKGSRGWL